MPKRKQGIAQLVKKKRKPVFIEDSRLGLTLTSESKTKKKKSKKKKKELRTDIRVDY